MEKRIRITQAIIDAYGRMNGDHDTIHYDHDYAVKRGFRGTLAHGLMCTAYVNGLAVAKYGPDWYKRGEFEVKYIAPTCPGDELVITLDDDGNVKCAVEAGVTMVGTARLRPAA